jgi:16S rRNA (uracil1498-N3)-methyltransferase
VFVDGSGGGRPLGSLRVREEDFHHLSKVLRLRLGEQVTASDGAGSWLVCRWKGLRELEPAGPCAHEAAPSPPLTVAFALTKGSHPEWAVQKLTEVGVDRVVLFTSARCVARWSPESAPRRLARLREVARQAAMQSRRVWLPVVEGPLSFSDLVGSAGAGVALAVPGGEPPGLETPTVLVGPEGGWADHELEAVVAHVSCGPLVLRSETAALAAGVILVALRSGLVGRPE